MDNNKFEIEILTRLTRIETKIEDFKNIEEKSNNAYNVAMNNKEKVEELESSIKWLSRTTAGAVIALIVRLVWDLIKIS